MGDFLKAAKQSVSETIEVAGHKVIVRGLTTGELSAIAKGREKDHEGLTRDLIVACCFDAAGKPLVPKERKAELDDIAPAWTRALQEAVARVNGFAPGNSSATDGEGSSSD